MSIAREGLHSPHTGAPLDLIGASGGFHGVGLNHNYWVVVNDMLLSDALVAGMQTFAFTV